MTEDLVAYQGAPTPRAFDPMDHLLPASMEDALKLAEMMSASNTLPAHLKKNPADCLRVIWQAVKWRMDPWSVADKTCLINGKPAYEAQLIAAVINRWAPLDERLQIDFEGTGDNLRVRVAGTVNGKVLEKISPPLKDAPRGSSPLWRSDPGQQLAYYTIKAWARLYFPDILLGVYTPDELSGTSHEVDAAAPVKDPLFDAIDITGDTVDGTPAEDVLGSSAGTTADDAPADDFPADELPPDPHQAVFDALAGSAARGYEALEKHFRSLDKRVQKAIAQSEEMLRLKNMAAEFDLKHNPLGAG